MPRARPSSDQRRWRAYGRVATAVLLAALATGCGTLQQDDLSSYVDQLHSDAVEGALLAGQAEQRRAPVTFVWMHSAELAHEVEQLRSHLYGEVLPAEVKTHAFAARVLAERISEALGGLHSNPGEQHAALRARQELQSAGEATKSLYEALQ